MNADLFAAETGIDSFDAARILDETRARMIQDGIGFITETVFSDPHGAKLTMLESAVEAGYEVTLIYIGVSSADLLARRVDQRIARGGHDVPRDRIASRFERSLRNLKSALSLVTTVKLYDNSDVDEPYRHVATFDHGSLTFRSKGRLPAWMRGSAEEALTTLRATQTVPRFLDSERSVLEQTERASGPKHRMGADTSAAITGCSRLTHRFTTRTSGRRSTTNFPLRFLMKRGV